MKCRLFLAGLNPKGRKIYFLIVKFESAVFRKFNEVILKLQGQGHIFCCAINRKWILNPQISWSRIRRKVQIKLDGQLRQMLNDYFSNIYMGGCFKVSTKEWKHLIPFIANLFFSKTYLFLKSFYFFSNEKQ